MKLGDMVEEAIQTVAPSLAEKYKNCSACARRKNILNSSNLKEFVDRAFNKNNNNANFG